FRVRRALAAIELGAALGRVVGAETGARDAVAGLARRQVPFLGLGVLAEGAVLAEVVLAEPEVVEQRVVVPALHRGLGAQPGARRGIVRPRAGAGPEELDELGR